MKKCPYCAEDIQDAAIICRYCGRDLVQPVQIGTQSSNFPQLSQHSVINEPHPLRSLFFGFLLIVGLDFGLVIFLPLLTNFPEIAEFGFLVGILGLRVMMGIIAVNGYKPGGATVINYFGMLLLAFVPLGSWIVLYYAGKAIARKASVVAVLSALLLMSVIGGATILLIVFLGRPNGTSLREVNHANTPTPRVGAAIPILNVTPMTTLRSIATRSPTITPLPDCYQPGQLNASMGINEMYSDDKITCVYGTLKSVPAGYYEDCIIEYGNNDKERTVCDTVPRFANIIEGPDGAMVVLFWVPKVPSELIYDKCIRYYGVLLNTDDGGFALSTLNDWEYCK